MPRHFSGRARHPQSKEGASPPIPRSHEPIRGERMKVLTADLRLRKGLRLRVAARDPLRINGLLTFVTGSGYSFGNAGLDLQIKSELPSQGAW
jgi:hypothetical protein